MRTLLAALIVVVSAAGTGLADDKDAKSDLDRLQGKWKAMRVIEAAVAPATGQPGRAAEEAQAAEFGAPAAHGSKSLTCTPPANRQ